MSDPLKPSAPAPPGPAVAESWPVAVIDIGATSIRLAIAEVNEHGSVRKLDSLSQAVALGKDTFVRGSISRGTIEDCVRALSSYRRVIDEYQIHSQIRVVATSAVREASNQLAFLDRVYVATGLEVEPLEEAEVNRITYMSIQPQLKSDPSLSSARSLVLEVGGGSTELLLVRGPNVILSHSFRLGSLRMRRALDAYNMPTVKLRGILLQQIDRAVEQIRRKIPTEEGIELIALGGDLRIAMANLQPDRKPAELTQVPVAALEEMADDVLALSDEEIVQRFHISFPDAETLGIALLANVRLARSLGLDHLRISNANLRDGLLQDMSHRKEWSSDFTQQIVRSAVDLAHKYEVDLDHGRHVAHLARHLFAELRELHMLDPHYDVLLSVAALLHEIGHFVSIRSHHKHSMYLIRNSELFGLGRRDMLLIALVARYHRRASPQPQHESYGTLPRDQRVAVAKMAALLRVAKALDDTRTQRVKEFACRTAGSRLLVSAPLRDLSLEQLALRQSGSLFEEVFGLQVLLRTDRK